jgi:cysteine desulfurase/selenocysteine lyase
VNTQDFDAVKVRGDFPILNQQVNGHPLVYLDSAATSQKPRQVIDAISDYYLNYNSNVHRAAHTLSDRATQAFESSRTKVASFINSPQPNQVIWTRGTTESINLVANTWGEQEVKAGATILVSELEHHSNIVPWQMLAQRKGAKVVAIAVTESGEIDLDDYQQKLDSNVALVAISQISNALGTVNPIAEIIAAAKANGSVVLIDGAQAIAHTAVDMQAMGADFYTFSGHKLFGPTGIGVLWGRADLLEAMPPWQGGGEMIDRVSFAGTTYNTIPHKFEAGTPDIAGAIGLGAAIDYLHSINFKAAAAYEQSLLDYCLERAEQVPQIQRIGHPHQYAAVFSFLVEGTHPSDIGMLLDQQGVAIRTGHHCAQPLMEAYGLPGTARASFAFYNNRDDVDRLFDGLAKAISMFSSVRRSG